jgi:ActR/RegA family two-component response regulator
VTAAHVLAAVGLRPGARASLDAVAEAYVLSVLVRERRNRVRSARVLGVDRRSLQRRLRWNTSEEERP